MNEGILQMREEAVLMRERAVRLREEIVEMQESLLHRVNLANYILAIKLPQTLGPTHSPIKSPTYQR